MKKIVTFALVAALGSLPALGCSRSTSNGGGEPAASTSSASTNDAPKGTKFARIKEGMSRSEVRDILGAPKEQQERFTGKNWIPWYFGADRKLTIYFYPKQGRVVFGNTGFIPNTPGDVLYVEYDAKEDGFADTN